MTMCCKELARQFFREVWNERRVEAIGEYAHPDGIAHHTNGHPTDTAHFRDVVHKQFLDAFPDLVIDVKDVVAEGERVVVRWHASGTHLGDGLGIRASQQRVNFFGMTWFVFRQGKIAEGWDSWDHGGLLQTLWRAAPPTGYGA